jgi:hypothetical protein
VAVLRAFQIAAVALSVDFHPLVMGQRVEMLAGFRNISELESAPERDALRAIRRSRFRSGDMTPVTWPQPASMTAVTSTPRETPDRQWRKLIAPGLPCLNTV